jgi:hypothetical protein
MEKYKNETLLKKLNVLDNKYHDAIMKPSNIGFGYGMRAYHAIKTMNPPEWKYKDRANVIKSILEERNVLFHTYYV